MTKKGNQKQRKGAKQDAAASRSQQQEQQPSSSQQQQQQPSGSQQQQPPGPQQQQPPAWQRPPGPQQQQRPPGPQQQQQRPPGPQQQQQRPPGPQQQQQRPPGPQQQQQQPQGPWQRPLGPQQQQQQQQPQGPWQRPPGPQQQQQQPQGPWQRPPGPQQQQQRPPGPQQQQQRPPGPQQQQQRPPGPQQQQQQPQGPWQRPLGPQQQQQQQQPQGPWQRPPGPQQQQQQQQPQGPWQRPPGPQQQQQQQQPQAPWQRPPGPQQQQQRPPGPQQQQQRPPGPQKQQQQPPGPQQQQQQPPAASQQKQQIAKAPVVLEEVPVIVKSTSSKISLSTAMQQLYVDQIPKRSGRVGGTAGRPITVETNMFRINFGSMFQKNVVHYDVVIDPDRPKFLMRPVFEEYRKMFFPNRYPAFDGKKNAYSGQDLPFGDHSQEADVKVFDVERQQERTFKMYMKKVALLDLSWLTKTQLDTIEFDREQKGIQALDVILRHGPLHRFIPVGRSLFQQPEPGRVVSLSNGLDLWVGVFQSAVVGWRTYLNIDVAHKGFPTPQSVMNLMRELCQNPRSNTESRLSPDEVKYNSAKIMKFLKGLKIQYEIPGQPNTKRTYRVNELVDCPRKNKFSLDNGTLSTVEDYFSQTKKYRLQFPDLPCLWVGSRTNQKKIHLPVELCTIVAGQVTQKKMDEVQTSKMIREAATDTNKRKQKIMSGFASMKLNEQPTLMKEFHLSVQGEFEKVPARVLQAPQLQYDQKRVNVFKGVWRAEKFLNPCDLPENTWTILCLDRYVQDRNLYELHEKLQRGGAFVKMSIGKPITPFVSLNIQNRNINEVLNYFNEKKKQNLRLVVVIIPPLDTAYSLVKQISELKVTGGVVTQCLKSQTLKKLSDATITNILLKINSKLNGINHTFAQRPRCLNAPCMLVGADVTHPSPDAVDIPSIAAVAASHDPNAFKYNIELRLQSPREEMIQDLENIMRKQLVYFYKKTGQKPCKIIFYRDGVSEGQLPQVMHYELSAIKKALAKLDNSTEHKIPITFLVVQKRHHIRLFPTDAKNSDDRNFNVQAGTIVDTEITHPTHVDFYLVSHASIQGTARPTKYRCICNENQLSEDEIEQLTYYLCHMFARCTRSVSYPAPTYYAHLAAFRARAWIHNVPLNISNLQEEQLRKMTMQMENSPMFFV
ncbi:argonaute 2 isoform X5 [Andrena cerasifolii]|uniref:argonaute 2 isoform X5 n=1 Tax=Andrena cerasifolii TaxID=2819439 RepID=UPI004037DCE3